MADILRLHGPGYLERFGESILPSHRRAMRDLCRCRTDALGGQLFVCDRCGREHYVYHSCRNRACPKCHGKEAEAWLTARRQELLPAPYFHLVFTLPGSLRRLVRRHQRVVYSILMKAAARALMKLAADPKYVGGRIAVLAVLHTWSRTLSYHPHVHCLVPGGGLSDDGQWKPSRANYLVPVRALSRIFRGLFLELLAKALPDVAIPDAAARQDWVVYCKPTVQGADNVLSYLGRYVHRIAISNQRIIAVADGQVTFRYRKVKETRWRTMTLPADEFIRRFLQHVLPSRVHKVRYYGLWAPSNKSKLLQLRRRLTTTDDDREHASVADDGDSPPAQTDSPPRRCPFCHNGTLLFLRRVPALQRPPP